MSVNIDSVINYNEGKGAIPAEFTVSMMNSNDMDVLNKIQREIIPREASTFGHQTAADVVSTDTLSSKLTFYVSDPRMYMDMMSSYFTADFRAIVRNAAGNAVGSYLDAGGIHACIKALVIKIGGSVLYRLDDYNKWYNIMNLGSHSPDYVDFQLAASADSFDDFKIERDVCIPIPFTVVGSSYDKAGGAVGSLLTLAGAVMDTGLVQNGDTLEIVHATANIGSPVRARVLNVTGATTVQLDDSIMIDLGANMTRVTIIKRVYRSTRSRIVNAGIAEGAATGAGGVNATLQKIQWKLPAACLNFFKYFPLPYIQDVAPLEIEYEFCNSRLALVLGAQLVPAIDTFEFGYLISKPRYVVSLVEPSEKVRKLHDAAYNNVGIWFPYVNYRHYQNRLNNNDTDAVFTIQSNYTSARRVFSVLTLNTNDDSSNVGAISAKSQSSFFRGQIRTFRFASGSLKFPDYGDVQVENFAAAEAWAQLLLAFNTKDNIAHVSQITPWEWQNTTGTKFIIATPLAKDETPWTGLSLKNNFLEFSITKTAEAVVYNVHTYLGYDCALCIARSAGVRVFD